MPMYKIVDGVKMEMTQEEIDEMNRETEVFENEYWSQDYNTLVDNEIRKRYSISEEFSILRQKAEKPEEFNEYFTYCEQCKLYVKGVLNGKNKVL